MKKLVIKILPAALILFLSGCYTVMWNPKTKLPSENQEYNYYYYTPDYYGDYYYYYERPWWWSINASSTDEPYRRSNEINTLRNSGGRQSDNDRDIIKTDRPSVDSGNSSNKPDASKSGSGNSSSTTRPSNSGSKDNGSLRNNDGSRNSGSRR